VVSTITSNILTINYASNNGQSIFVTPTANFSLVLTNVSTGILNAIYKLDIYISAKFYCTGITVNGTVLTMNAVGGLVNIASQVNASATVLIQTFTIFFTGTSTPSRVITELKSTW
jgi:heme A synthase